MLFQTYSIYTIILRHLEDIEGVRVGSENINNLRYANDTVLISLRTACKTYRIQLQMMAQLKG